MTSIVLLVLVAAWAGYLFMWWKDGRSAAPPRRNGIHSFSNQLGSLAGSARRATAQTTESALRTTDLSRVPRTTDDAARRRREVAVVIGGLALMALVAVPFVGGLALAIHVVLDLMLAAFGYMVMRRRHLSAEREIKVRMLYPDRPPAPVPELVPIRRTVNG